jgi:hypothetical protein
MRTVRASEVGEFVYCRRAWWYRQVQGLASANVRELQAGTETHARHGRRVGLALGLRALAALAALAGLLLLLAAAWPG